ncbi:MAG: hypothetical protein WC455_25040 [Dehalococcoidia bacterium]
MGGGAAGTVSLPTYMAVYHAWMMDADRSTTNTATGHNWSATAGVGSMNVYDDTYAARSGPYDGADAYDPTDALDDMLTEVQEFETAITALSPTTDFQTYFDKVKANLGDLVYDEDLPVIEGLITPAAPGTVASITVNQISLPTINVAEMVTAFENRQALSHARSVAAYAAGASDLNAVMGSAFVIGVGIKETEKQYNIDEFDAKVSLSAEEKEFDGELQAELAYQRALLERDMQAREVQARYDLQDQQVELEADKIEFMAGAEIKRLLPQLRVQAYTQGINMMAAMLGSKMGLMDSETSKQLQYGQSRIIAETDETNRNLEIDHLDFTWNLSLYDYSARWMGAASGSAVPVSGKPSSIQSALGGAMSGAAMGGSVGGPVGAGIGAIAGGIGGLL